MVLYQFNQIFVHSNVGATLAVALKAWAGASPAPTIGEIIGTFKSVCVLDRQRYKKENKIAALARFCQHNYYEHIIRSEDSQKKSENTFTIML